MNKILCLVKIILAIFLISSTYVNATFILPSPLKKSDESFVVVEKKKSKKKKNRKVASEVVATTDDFHVEEKNLDEPKPPVLIADAIQESYWLNLFLGGDLIKFKQTTETSIGIKFDKTNIPSVKIQAGKNISSEKKWEINASYSQGSIENQSAGYSLDSKKVTLFSIGSEFYWPMKRMSLLGGGELSQVPFVISEGELRYSFTETNLISATAGIAFINKKISNIKCEGKLKYSYPIFARASGLSNLKFKGNGKVLTEIQAKMETGSRFSPIINLSAGLLNYKYTYLNSANSELKGELKIISFGALAGFNYEF